MIKAIADRERDSKIKAAFGLGHILLFSTFYSFLFSPNFIIFGRGEGMNN